MSLEPEHIETVAPDVIRVPVFSPTLPPATRTNSYLVTCTGGRLLVDAGAHTDDGVQHLLLAAQQSEAEPVVGLVLTHQHIDHVIAARQVANELQVPLYAHPLTWSALHSGGWVPDPGHRTIEAGDTLYGLTVLGTPGHASGHLSLRSDSGSIVAGDLVAGTGTILIDPGDGDMGAYLDSLERIRALDAPRLLPAHGPAIEDPTPWLTFYLHHRRARESRVLNAVQAAGCTLSEVAREAYADAPTAPLALTERSTLAHLLDLERQGLVRSAEDGRWRLR